MKSSSLFKSGIAFGLAYLLILGTSFIFFNDLPSSKEQPLAVNGVMDLSGWNWVEHEVVQLDGEWEFYPGQFVGQDPFPAPSDHAPAYLSVPSSWGKQSQELQQSQEPQKTLIPSRGYGTYRLVIKNVGLDGIVGLKKTNIRSSAKIYVNGQEILKDGLPSERAQDYTFSNVPQVSYFQADSGDLEILVHVSNYDYFQGGISGPILLGSQKAISNIDNKAKYLDIAIQMTLLVIGLVYLLLSLLVKHYQGGSQTVISFGFLCLSLAVGLMMRQERTLYLLFPGLTYEIGIRLLFFTVISTTALLAIFFSRISSAILSKNLRNFVLSICAAYLLLLIFLPFSIYSTLIQVQLIANSVFFLWILIKAIYSFALKPETGISRSNQGVLILSLLSLNVYQVDSSLYGSGLIYHLLVGTTSIFLFALSLIFFLATEIAETEKNKQQIKKQLALQEKEALAHEIAFLRSQINPHFLFNTLSVILHMLESDSVQAGNLLENFSTYLRNSFDFQASEQQTTVEKEIDLAKAYLTIQQSRFLDRLQVEWQVDPSMLACRIPALSLEPLLENAVQYGVLMKEEGGRVRIRIAREQGKLLVEVWDDGVGMSQERIHQILTQEVPLSDHRKGIGISNIQQRLAQQFNSCLQMESALGQGTRVWFFVEAESC